MIRYWIGVACRDHVKVGEAGGFCQLGHGKKAPVQRLSPGDGIVYYAPRTQIKAGDSVKSFVAIGQVQSGNVYTVNQTENFCPHRRDVQYFLGQDAPIHPLLGRLSFSSNGQNWGFMMHRGSFEITVHDFNIIAEAMGVLKSVDTAFKE